MSNESSNELIMNPAPHIAGPMSKNRIMQFTFVALLIITAISAAIWSEVTINNYWTGENTWNLGLVVVICALIAVGIAVGTDFLMYKAISDCERNTWSAAVFGLIVTCSYTLGLPTMNTAMMGSAVEPPGAFVFVAVISFIGLTLFKKIQGIAGRKFVNPAAAAKFLVLLPMIAGTLLASDHLSTGGLGIPSLAGPIGWTSVLGNNGMDSFGNYMIGCFANPMLTPPAATIESATNIMVLAKYHSWVGGASSLAVIIIGIALFAIGRKYFKWRVTASYFIGAAIMSVLMSTMFGDADLLLRLFFTIFVGSSIFMAFFMATDPATSPYTGTGQIIFGVGIAVLTVLMQTYMNFFGASLLALLIMNLTVPLLDKVGIHKSFGR